MNVVKDFFSVSNSKNTRS